MADADFSARNFENHTGDKRILLLISGKRKCGKDYLSQLVYQRLGSTYAFILHISAPLKKEYAEMKKLDFDRLLDTSDYKEKYRPDMVKWGEEMRQKDCAYFCRKAVELAENCGKPILIVADIRRKTDVEYFNNFQNLKLRVESTPEVRSGRGWVFTKGIDDSETEVDLDDYEKWDFRIKNNGNKEALDKAIETVCAHLKKSVGL